MNKNETLSASNRSAMLCELHILKKHGIERTEKQWLQQAFQQGWLNSCHKDLCKIGNVLKQECFHVNSKYHATLDDVAKELKAGNDIIAIVDSNELTRDLNKLSIEYEREQHFGPNPNLAVVIDAYDPETQKLTIFDPSRGTYEFPAKLFLEAWDDSTNNMFVISARDFTSYEPHPIDLSGVELPAFINELCEVIAENAHEVWAQGRREQGWTYGSERNDALKQTPDMIPYSDLPEAEKQYDRDMATNTIKLLYRLGYKIVEQ